MKYVSEKYEAQLDQLSETLMRDRRLGQLSLVETVEPSNVIELFPQAQLPFPPAA